MKFSYKLSDAVHILSYLYIYHDGDLSSRAIAKSIESNPSVVRQLMSDLREAGIIETRKGTAAPHLVKQPVAVSLRDIYLAINMDHDLLHIDPKTNPQCVVGGNIQDTLDSFYARVQKAALDEMATISLADVIDDILAKQRVKEKQH
ncbi:Rrf2 family transcriptional regulator [Limosilactobacillus sp.]|uniref:Rrf2 family transcriptional regulator n=1 Tax=Limosilactobacillus sp. TaxID=2773925 RepID=UPI003EFE22AC